MLNKTFVILLSTLTLSIGFLNIKCILRSSRPSAALFRLFTTTNDVITSPFEKPTTLDEPMVKILPK